MMLQKASKSHRSGLLIPSSKNFSLYNLRRLFSSASASAKYSMNCHSQQISFPLYGSVKKATNLSAGGGSSLTLAVDEDELPSPGVAPDAPDSIDTPFCVFPSPPLVPLPMLPLFGEFFPEPVTLLSCRQKLPLLPCLFGVSFEDFGDPVGDLLRLLLLARAVVPAPALPLSPKIVRFSSSASGSVSCTFSACTLTHRTAWNNL